MQLGAEGPSVEGWVRAGLPPTALLLLPASRALITGLVASLRHGRFRLASGPRPIPVFGLFHWLPAASLQSRGRAAAAASPWSHRHIANYVGVGEKTHFYRAPK